VGSTGRSEVGNSSTLGGADGPRVAEARPQPQACATRLCDTCLYFFQLKGGRPAAGLASHAGPFTASAAMAMAIFAPAG
jgi:hypothetical protein